MSDNYQDEKEQAEHEKQIQQQRPTKKYLECGSWKLADIHPQQGKRAVLKGYMKQIQQQRPTKKEDITEIRNCGMMQIMRFVFVAAVFYYLSTYGLYDIITDPTLLPAIIIFALVMEWVLMNSRIRRLRYRRRSR